MIVKQIPVGPMMNRSYLIVCEKTREAAIVDPAWELDTLTRELRAARGDLRILLCTHGHGDHVNLVSDLLNQFPNAKAVCHELERIPAPKSKTHAVKDGDMLLLGEIEIRCMHTPGHTPGSVTYIADDHAFFGDTLFAGENCGRVDLYGDGPRDMAASLQRIRGLPGHLTVCSGHTYGRLETSTMDFEKTHNAALQCKTIEEFLNWKG